MTGPDSAITESTKEGTWFKVNALYTPWLEAPGFYHGLIDGHPASGQPVITTNGPTVPVSLGEIAGREIVVNSGSLTWLADMETAFRTARERLSGVTFPGPRGAAA